jgi:hypothetical protein
MSDEICWVILRRNGAEEARQASNMNLALVMAADPESARGKATAANTFGESYLCPHGYCVVSLDAFMSAIGGIALIRGDLPNPVRWPANAAHVF